MMELEGHLSAASTTVFLSHKSPQGLLNLAGGGLMGNRKATPAQNIPAKSHHHFQGPGPELSAEKPGRDPTLTRGAK